MSHRETELFELAVCLLASPSAPSNYPAFEQTLVESSDLPDFVVSDVGHKAWKAAHQMVKPISVRSL